MTALSTLLAKIDADEVVELTRALIRIPSVHRPGDPDANESRVAAFVKAMRHKGPSFAIAAISGEGCRPLVYAIQEWLDAHPAEAVAPEPVEAGTPQVLTPAPMRARRRRASPPAEDA